MDSEASEHGSYTSFVMILTRGIMRCHITSPINLPERYSAFEVNLNVDTRPKTVNLKSWYIGTENGKRALSWETWAATAPILGDLMIRNAARISNLDCPNSRINKGTASTKKASFPQTLKPQLFPLALISTLSIYTLLALASVQDKFIPTLAVSVTPLVKAQSFLTYFVVNGTAT